MEIQNFGWAKSWCVGKRGGTEQKDHVVWHFNKQPDKSGRDCSFPAHWILSYCKVYSSFFRSQKASGSTSSHVISPQLHAHGPGFISRAVDFSEFAAAAANPCGQKWHGLGLIKVTRPQGGSGKCSYCGFHHEVLLHHTSEYKPHPESWASE